ncbi:MAG: TRAP transporter large permease subunit [Burkholderiaceae bacterium]
MLIPPSALAVLLGSIAQQLGLDLVSFGVLMLLVLGVSLATPPFGLLLFVTKGASPETDMRDFVLFVLSFVLIVLAVVALLIAFPGIALILPQLIAR